MLGRPWTSLEVAFQLLPQPAPPRPTPHPRPAQPPSKLIQDAGSEPKHGIDAPIDEPLAEHLPCPHHLPFDLLAFFTPLLLPLKPFSQLLQVLLPLVGAPVLSDVLVRAI